MSLLMLLYIDIFLYDKIIALILNISLFNSVMLCKENAWRTKFYPYKFYCKKVLLLLLKNIILLK